MMLPEDVRKALRETHKVSHDIRERINRIDMIVAKARKEHPECFIGERNESDPVKLHTSR